MSEQLFVANFPIPQSTLSNMNTIGVHCHQLSILERGPAYRELRCFKNTEKQCTGVSVRKELNVVFLTTTISLVTESLPSPHYIYCKEDWLLSHTGLLVPCNALLHSTAHYSLYSMELCGNLNYTLMSTNERRQCPISSLGLNELFAIFHIASYLTELCNAMFH